MASSVRLYSRKTKIKRGQARQILNRLHKEMLAFADRCPNAIYQSHLRQKAHSYYAEIVAAYNL
jgi:hypothetical protein